MRGNKSDRGTDETDSVSHKDRQLTASGTGGRWWHRNSATTDIERDVGRADDAVTDEELKL